MSIGAAYASTLLLHLECNLNNEGSQTEQGEATRGNTQVSIFYIQPEFQNFTELFQSTWYLPVRTHTLQIIKLFFLLFSFFLFVMILGVVRDVRVHRAVYVYEPRKTKSPVFSRFCNKGFFMGIRAIIHSN